MPGVVGVVGTSTPGRLDAALRKMAVLPGSVATRHAIAEPVELASVSRGRAGAPAASFAQRDGAAVLLYGSAFVTAPQPRRLVAEDLLAAAQDGALAAALADCDGGYVAVAVNRRARTLTVVADRVGSQPVYFGSRGDCFAFAAEAKAVLTALSLPARLSRAGVLGFLTRGYNLADQTLFEGVSYLEPGTSLTVDLASRRLTLSRYWALSFRGDPRLERRATAEEAMCDGILRAHRLLLADRPAEHQVLLSGGLDSRGMLAALCRIGAPPRQAVAWGLRKDIARSDAWIAERLAAALQVPFHFLPYDSDVFVGNAEEWAFTSELANDNIGWYGEGVGSLRDLWATRAAVSFVGDEVFGFGRIPRDETTIRSEAAMPPRVAPIVASTLRSDAAEEAGACDEAVHRRVMSHCDSASLMDRAGHLYLHGRLARFIMSLGYYKEHATEVRRPYLSRAVLEVTTALPPRLRAHKNLYRTTLTRFFPEVMHQPPNLASSLPDWRYDVRRKPQLRALFLELLDPRAIERGALADLVDVRTLQALTRGFFDAPAEAAGRDVPLVSGMYMAARNRYRALARAHVWATARRTSTAARDRTSPFDVLRRVALLTLLQRRLGDLSAS